MTYEDGTAKTGEWRDDELLLVAWRFENAQEMARRIKKFDAPSIEEIKTLTPGSSIKVHYVDDNDEGGERFWVAVIENRRNDIRGTVDNDVLNDSLAYMDEVIVPHECVYDFVTKERSEQLQKQAKRIREYFDKEAKDKKQETESRARERQKTDQKFYMQVRLRDLLKMIETQKSGSSINRSAAVYMINNVLPWGSSRSR